MSYSDSDRQAWASGAPCEELEASIESKIVAIRDGSCTYTADEIAYNLIEEAEYILQTDLLSAAIRPDDMDDDLDYSEMLGELADEAESKLADAGYQVFHNDGFVIYKDLTQAESDYLGGF